MYRKRRSFTLAEVLITLAIIGVVAAITIPALNNSTKESEYNEGIKKVMSELSNALNLIQTNNGGSVAVGTGDANTDHTAFRDEFCSVMNCSKKDTAGNIFKGLTYKYYKGGDYDLLFDSSRNSSALLNNGILLYFVSYSSCSNWGVNMCGVILADINGIKRPNMVGKDMYEFYVSKKNGTSFYSILPAGVQGDSVHPLSTCVINTQGWGCTYLRLYSPDKLP